MLKPDLLRQMISQHVPWLRENPDNLAVYLRKGRMVSTASVLLRLSIAIRWKCW